MQPTNYPFNPKMFGEVAFPGDWVGLQVSNDKTQNIYGKVFGVYTNPLNEVNFGQVLNTASTTPAQALTSSVDQLAVGIYEFSQVRFKLDPRDFDLSKSPGSDAQIQLYQPGQGNSQWQSANVAWRFAPNLQVDYGPYSHWTEHFYRGNVTPFYSVVNNSGGTLTNTRIMFQLIHYWYSRGGMGDANMPSESDVLNTPTGHIVYIPIGQFASTGTSVGVTPPNQ